MSKYIIKGICKECWGKGYVRKGPEKIICERCDGTGEVDRTVQEIHSDGSRARYPADHSIG